MQPARLGAGLSCFVSTTLLGLFILALPARAQVVLETPQQANDRIRELSATSRKGPHDYIIGNGDVLSVDVFDVKELSRDVRVSQTGTIGIPLVPVRLRVSGLTEIQAQQKIAEVLEANGLVSHPDVARTRDDVRGFRSFSQRHFRPQADQFRQTPDKIADFRRQSVLCFLEYGLHGAPRFASPRFFF